MPPDQSPYHDFSARLGCCLLERATFTALGRPSAAHLSLPGKLHGFRHRLDLAGLRVIHADDVRMATTCPLPDEMERLTWRADQQADAIRMRAAQQATAA
jgi:hypothetical protein